MRLWLSVAFILLGACGNDAGAPTPGDDTPTDPDACETSYLRYENFGAVFSSNWCRGCHSASVPSGMRQNAPANVNFDTEADLTKWATAIRTKATGATATMPPAGGPSDEERALLAEWIDCGMK